MMNQLQRLFHDACYACFYINKEKTTAFIFGKILGIINSQIAIYMVSPEGDYDGVIVINIDAIYRIEWKDLYSQDMKARMNEKELPQPAIAFCDGDFFETLLDYSIATKTVVTIEVMNSGYEDLIGFVESKDDLYCTVRQISKDGFPDGYSMIRLEDITQVCCESADEIRLKELYMGNMED